MALRSFYKIIHTSSRTVWGTTEERIFRESLWMIEKGHQIIVIAPSGSPLFMRAKKMGIQVYPLSFNRLAHIGEYSRLKRIFAAEKPFAVNCHGQKDAGPALKAAGKTGVDCRIISQHAGSRIKKAWFTKRKYNQYCDYTFTDSPKTIPLLQKFFKIKNIRIFSIPRGIIEPPTLPHKAEAHKELSFRFGLPPDTRFVGFTGQMPLSRLGGMILQTFESIKTQLPHHMVIASDQPQAFPSDLKEDLVRATQGRIHFLDFEEEAWPLYRALDCMVFLPKKDEVLRAPGIPQRLLEMMYAQCPVIAPKHSRITDIINHSQNDMLFDHDSQEKRIGELVLQTICQKSETLKRAAAAGEHIRQHYTIDAMGRDILRIYRLHQIRLEKERHFY